MIENFEELRGISNENLQLILREIDSEELAMALKGASAETIDSFKRNMGEHAIEVLEEDMRISGHVPLGDVEAMQHKIVNTVNQLKDNGIL